MYHTSAQGAKLADDPKQHEHTPLGRHGHLVQLNAAGRQVITVGTAQSGLLCCSRLTAPLPGYHLAWRIEVAVRSQLFADA